MIILVDQDGPLANFENGFLKIWRARFPNEVFVQLESRTSLEIYDDYPEHLKDRIEVVYRNAPGFYLGLDPIPGAKEALDQMLALGHDVHICTSPLKEYEDCVLEKFQWIDRHLGPTWVKRTIITKDKTIVRGQFLIDDRPGIKGILQPEWEHILFDEPYNRKITGKRRLNWSNWREVLGI